jgi:uncharacterized protein YfaS (alpha-2-macroglobulin family)
MLEVSTSQVLDLILPDFARFSALAAPGGDADAGFASHLNPFARKRKAAAAYWSGIVSVGREGATSRMPCRIISTAGCGLWRSLSVRNAWASRKCRRR